MEVAGGSFHAVFPITDASCIGEARRHAAGLASELAWSDTERGRVAIVVNELGTNLLRHAESGRLLVRADREQRAIEAIAIDEGPGIADVPRAMRDGYSTANTPGTGLGAVRRQADDFDLHSSVPGGTVVVARVRSEGARASRFVVGAVSTAAPGEHACGDGWLVCSDEGRAAVLVADGLGHGPDAHVASAAALALFRGSPFMELTTFVQSAHAALRTTRGAAALAVQLDDVAAKVSCCGAGNVVARLLSGVVERTLLSQNGTLGARIRRPDVQALDWPPHALLIVHSDGVETRWKKDLLLPLLGRDPALVAALLLRDHARGRDDATVVVVRRRG
jgi:anti-sigma regulatory factor (Ser/Thr protein kinase)